MKRSPYLSSLACAATFTLAAAFPLTSSADPAKDGSHAAAHGSMDHSSMNMKMPGMSMTGDANHDFAKNMRMHHQMGVDMAKKYLKEGDDAKLKEKAQKIVSGQNKEIAEFDQWLAEHGKR